MPKRVPPRERGAALLTVLLLVAVMAVITATALERLTLATKLTGNAAALDQARAYSYASELLAAAKIADLVAAQGNRTTLQGEWNARPFTLPIPGGLGTATVTDGGNCFNVNSLVSGGGEDGASNFVAQPVAERQFQALMGLLGVDAGAAQLISAAAIDWIDSDDAPRPNGAESDTYLQGAVPYRAANQLMADPSEMRVLRGMTPAIYAKLRPWICALPVAELSPINVNTLLPAQAPLLAMLLPGQLSVGQARELLARRPANGYESTTAFWAVPALAGVTSGNLGAQTVIKTRWFVVESDIELAGAVAHETALYDAQTQPGQAPQPARLVRRSWGDDG